MIPRWHDEELDCAPQDEPEDPDELFLTVKTIETHLRNIFRKLGVSSRVEVARLLERERREESR